MSDQEYEQSGVRFTDKRRVDPETNQVRQPAGSAGAPGLLDALQEESDEATVLEVEVVEAQAKLSELTNDLQRVHAEYANYRRRVDRDRELVRETAIGGALSELLPIIDDVDRARQHGELDGAFKSVGEALESAVVRIGLEKFGAAGESFDPNVHEALTTESRDDVSEPTVVSVYQSGYRFAGRVLRPARVAVAGTD
ncbi:MAG: nucleotide exchange factor GrpE [Actinobacteria bacterium]|nr:nucleotide exchange factor GrpE [Actinomycetota bacterium]